MRVLGCALIALLWKMLCCAAVPCPPTASGLSLCSWHSPRSWGNTQRARMSSSPVFGLNSKRSLCGFPFQSQLRKGFVANPRPEARRALNAGLCACLCLFHVTVHSLAAHKAEAATAPAERAPVGPGQLCLSAWRAKEPPPGPKHLPMQDIIAVGMAP